MDKLIAPMAFGFYGIALLGIVAHAVKKWAMREIHYSVYDYLFTVDRRGSLITVATVLGSVIGAVGSGSIASLHTFADVSTAFLIGFAFDSAICPANATSPTGG
jgi:hypothetical protein